MGWQAFESKLLISSGYDAGKHILYLRFRTAMSTATSSFRRSSIGSFSMPNPAAAIS